MHVQPSMFKYFNFDRSPSDLIQSHCPSFPPDTAAARDENDEEYLAHVGTEIGGVAERIQEIYSS